MKNNISLLILFLVDIFVIYISLSLAYFLRLDVDTYLETSFSGSFDMYVYNFLFYFVVLVSFNLSKIYHYRYDFWEETRIVFRSLIVSWILVLAMLALAKTVGEYSRLTLSLAFVFMIILIPTSKNLLKKLLFKLGLWKRSAEICGQDNYVKKEIFGNSYLGYVHTSQTDAQTIFVDTHGISAQELQERLDISLKEKKEVLFIPLLQSYNFANARIIELSNARKNLIVLENALLKKSNILIKKISDIVLSILLFPFLIMIFVTIVFLMKREEPKGKIFFKQKRMGLNGKMFACYKFRSMYENGNEVLAEYLKEHPDEIVCYDKFHKYKNDPRITKVGRILRKTSLDELPQVINVLKGEMSLIGPRPYMRKERKKISNDLDMVLAVKPGITGLWQVSGRNELDFKTRVDIDIWYTRNWNLWLDLVILVKTIKVVLFRDGAS